MGVKLGSKDCAQVEMLLLHELLQDMPNFLKEESLVDVHIKESMGPGRVLPNSKMDSMSCKQIPYASPNLPP